MTTFKSTSQALFFLTPAMDSRKSQISLINRLEKRFTEMGVDPDSIKFNKLISVSTDKGDITIKNIIADGIINRLHDRNLLR